MLGLYWRKERMGTANRHLDITGAIRARKAEEVETPVRAIVKGNMRAIRLYASHGFVQIGSGDNALYR